MRRYIWTLALLASVMQGFAQEPDDAAGELTVGAQFAFGNLALREFIRENEPVQQLKEFFAGIKLPLSKEQERELDKIVDAQRNDWQALQEKAGAENPPTDATRKLNQTYVAKVNAILTPEQRNEWRHYRIDQIRLRGGFPALKAILDNAGVNLAVDQEKSIEKIFENFALRHARLDDSNPGAGVAEVDRLVVAEFNRVVALLTPEQRRALLASRPGGSGTRSRTSSR